MKKQTINNNYLDKIPEKYQEYIKTLKDNPKSGLNMIGTHNENISTTYQKILDNCDNVPNFILIYLIYIFSYNNE